MSAPTLLLVVGILAAWSGLVSAVRVRHPAFWSFPVMMTGWLVGEWPLFHAAGQVLTATVLVAFGGLDEPRGVVGLLLTLTAAIGLIVAHRTAGRAAASAEAALRAGLGPDYLDRVPPDRRAALRTGPDPRVARRPFTFDAGGIERIDDLAYGPHGVRNLLDVYRPAAGVERAPVILQVHGGAWLTGHKRQQARPLLHRLAADGYVAVSINYRLGPRSRFPDPIVDVKRAIAWVRTHIAEYGGDPDRIVLTGGSAGGHLVMLAALTPGWAPFQPGFEEVDTTVQACIPFYGVPDLCDRDGIRGRLASMEPMLARMVMPGPRTADPELWDTVSPIARVGPQAPPFFVIQGSHDVLVWREEARRFVDRLRAVSANPVVYWEVPGAQHAFDMLNSRRSVVAVDAVERFVGWVTAPSDASASEPQRWSTR